MKKILGLLVTVAIGSMVACNESGETAVAPSYQNPSQQQAQNPQVNTDSIAQHVRDSIEALYAQSSSSAAVDPFAGQFVSSSSDLMPMFSSSSIFVGFSSSSSLMTFLSSSSIMALSSSSAITPKSSATVEVDDGKFKLALWDGTAGDKQVPTGNKTGGYWYMYDDSGDKGKSTLTWGAATEDDDVSPVIDECGGLCGDFDLVVGSNQYKPYVGVGFNYAKAATTTADASAINGICVVYQSTIPILLEMGLGSLDSKIGYANPFVTLPASVAAKTVNYLWSAFEQPDWTAAKNIVDNPQKAIASFKFKFSGEEDGEDGGSGSFNIMKVGPYNGCN